MATQTELGAVGSLWRYPVKSMMGEELNAAEVTERGLRGDRPYALVDCADVPNRTGEVMAYLLATDDSASAPQSEKQPLAAPESVVRE